MSLYSVTKGNLDATKAHRYVERPNLFSAMRLSRYNNRCQRPQVSKMLIDNSRELVRGPTGAFDRFETHAHRLGAHAAKIRIAKGPFRKRVAEAPESK
jgi:hypothetical protein